MSKSSYVGAPAIFLLSLACRQINEAFHDEADHGHCYLVGSALERPDWRDVDVRYVMGDAAFKRLFPDAHDRGAWEFDPRWLLLTTALAAHLSKASGLPVDFQFQPATFANKHFSGARHPLGIRMAKPDAPGAGRSEPQHLPGPEGRGFSETVRSPPVDASQGR